MAQQIYITYKENFKDIADSISLNVFANASIEISDSMSSDDLYNLAKRCPTEFFYIIDADAEIVFDDFDFCFKPEPWDAEYLHMWGDKNLVRLYHKKSVLANAVAYSDSAIADGSAQLKMMPDTIYNFPKKDVIFISYDEHAAENNFALLLNVCPTAKRVKGVKGIYQAHVEAAKLSKTSLFYVVDADAILVDDFDFNYHPSSYDLKSTHVWYSKNPVNGLEYGYGGVKLFSKKLLLNYTGNPVDFTTSVSESFKVIPKVSNITQFNTDEFSAWRSGFRECTKLASKLIHKQDNSETEYRLNIWCTVGAEKPYGKFAIAGAVAGVEYGMENVNKAESIGLINDYNWLRFKFNNAYPEIALQGD